MEKKAKYNDLKATLLPLLPTTVETEAFQSLGRYPPLGTETFGLGWHRTKLLRTHRLSLLCPISHYSWGYLMFSWLWKLCRFSVL